MNARGFSLIEILAAMAVTAVSGLAAASLMVATTKAVGLNGTRSAAVVLAQEKVEELRTVDYDDIVAGSQVSGMYTLEWTVTEDPVLDNATGSEAGMKLITATVTWSLYGEPQTFSVSTVYADVNQSAS